MALVRFAFIVKGPGYSAGAHSADLVSEHFHTRVVGVADFPSAVQAAKRRVAERFQLIELCGGFSPAEASQLSAEMGHRVPVGVVSYSDEQTRAIQRLFE